MFRRRERKLASPAFDILYASILADRHCRVRAWFLLAVSHGTIPFCVKCGNGISEDAKFCIRCGSRQPLASYGQRGYCRSCSPVGTSDRAPNSVLLANTDVASEVMNCIE